MEFSYLYISYTTYCFLSTQIDIPYKKTYNFIYKIYVQFHTMSASGERNSMKRLNISELFPGMITAEDVYTYNNQLILQRGTVLTDKTITKLEFYSIFSVRVEDAMPSRPRPVVEEAFSSRVKSSPEFRSFKNSYDAELEGLQHTMNDLATKNAEVDVNLLLSRSLSLLENVKRGNFSVLDMLHNMRQYDDLTYAHSMNVALICNVFAGWLNMSTNDIQLATLCGLLHDIGKLKIPDSIIKKPDKLTVDEYEIIKTHPAEGYKMLNRLDLNDHIKNTALMHHERCDGSGYPLNMMDATIDPFAKMVAIADVYDAMTSARIYRGPQCPFTAIELFEEDGLSKYDPRYIMVFLQHIVNTYLQNHVRLSDGREGVIVYINSKHLSRPLVKCGNDVVDLSAIRTLSIDAII